MNQARWPVCHVPIHEQLAQMRPSNDNLVCSIRGLMEHGITAGGCLGFLLGVEVQQDSWDGRIICKAAGVLAVLEVNVSLLSPS